MRPPSHSSLCSSLYRAVLCIVLLVSFAASWGCELLGFGPVAYRWSAGAGPALTSACDKAVQGSGSALAAAGTLWSPPAD